ncbi:SDR family NAD(P)-dependent oxidoreductase [Rhodococcus sp. B50]|uniref:SDR family NAD(P)-dependent oxidoreductase n=1 Tax=Rhodococcus sp. B50 TaxID=2682847 RepID=UPI001BD44CCD|nr:SDR family NAD(P)-dependent oxidoreductase [Rhodococcus sp. B50]MBS9375186.1 Serine 3-dehydrogenase [Rhodococcus sp. B50]
MTDPAEFADRYGPWALILGASEGVGAEFARTFAARGLNVVLLSRRPEALEEVATEIRSGGDAETRILAVDLSAPDAMEVITEGTADLEIGTVVYCAGADPNFQPFLDNPVETAVGRVQRNCITNMRVCHHFAHGMVERGKGALILMSSAAGLRGGANMVAYGASKAFDMVMAEGLWSELKPHGVDVLSLVGGRTDTPALRRLLFARGAIDSLDAAVPGLATPASVVAEALDNLADGPTHLVGEQLQQAWRDMTSMTRSEAVREAAARQASFAATARSS